METYFATAQRASEVDLKIEIDTVVNNPVVKELLLTINGLIAVLDEHRQVLAMNGSFLQMMGIQNPGEVLGLRIGEVLKTFFHDIGNMLTGLLGASELLAKQNKDSKLAEVVRQSAVRLSNEVAIQRCIFRSDIGDYKVAPIEITTAQLLNDLKNVFTKHTASHNKNLIIQESLPPVKVRTDISLALRVMCNMVTNALEATCKNGHVKIWFEHDDDLLVFCVWNEKSITQEIRQRIFQRNFSTKEGAGRGIGTYSMQLLGEKLLGGKVSFSSSEEEGTTFRFALRRYLA